MIQVYFGTILLLEFHDVSIHMALESSRRQTFSIGTQCFRNNLLVSPKMETMKEQNEFDEIHIDTKVLFLFYDRGMEYQATHYTMPTL